MTMNEQTRCPRSRSAIMTASGRYWDALDPRPEWVHMPDVAHGLESPRFNNHTLVPVSVAGHQLRCGRLLVGLESRFDGYRLGVGVTFVEALFGVLVHDAAEGYLGDRLGPLKTAADSALEAATLAAIIRHLLDDDLMAERMTSIAIGFPLVKWIDKLACAHEALLWQPGANDWALPLDTHNANAIDPSTERFGKQIIAETITHVYPRPNEDWLLTVRRAVLALRGVKPVSFVTETLR